MPFAITHQTIIFSKMFPCGGLGKYVIIGLTSAAYYIPPNLFRARTSNLDGFGSAGRKSSFDSPGCFRNPYQSHHRGTYAGN